MVQYQSTFYSLQEPDLPQPKSCLTGYLRDLPHKTFDNLVAQTYDGASNMTGKYNGLQALIKSCVGEHVIFTHCYAHSLNLVLSDSSCISLQISKLFD